ncbi:hypothetical protein GV828_01490 [Flavobacterium sp. NST-5]|uniref:Transcriptional regulator n=1 Tax=Flavobacterium ichthyis TaxID=2698827 RepID=A0ABW9Z939_9FLAO|nr:hypothetical protein [Flavobacterium ichthyis]NBL63867.1 hypothetical protein [Flavobacterium ichthyis]
MNSAFEKYKNAVIAKYESEKNGKNADFLFDPTSGNLKKLCLEISLQELAASDKQILEIFFEKRKEGSLSTHIKNIHVDKFKNVSKFFRGEGNPSLASTLNMAALLVGFEDRPFAKFRNKDENKVGESVENKVNNSFVTVTRNETVPVKNVSSDKSFSFSKISLFLVTCVIVSIGGFFYYKSTEKKCMIWNGDHYERINCDDNTTMGIMHYTNIVSLHEETLQNFKKITPDSNTVFFKNGKAVIYYSKPNIKEVEFFSCDGVHPVTKKDLKPVTQYIINKYIIDKPRK